MLLLDAFDEVPFGKRHALQADIQKLAAAHEKLQVVMTSRPDNEAEFNPSLILIKLLRTDLEDIPTLVERLCIEDDKELATPINKALEETHHISDILTSPLMVALLIFRFRTDPSIPSTIVGFYDGIFEFMFARRDKWKFLTRERQSSCGFRTVERVVNHASFKLRRKSDGNIFDRETILTAFEEASNSEDTQDSGFNVLQDVCSISNLILREGNIYQYLHKTLVEFFASQHIRSRSDASRRKFYRQLTEDKLYHKWHQELKFLSVIDFELYAEEILIKTIDKVLAHTNTSSSDAEVWSYLREILQDIAVSIVPSSSGKAEPLFLFISNNANIYDITFAHESLSPPLFKSPQFFRDVIRSRVKELEKAQRPNIKKSLFEVIEPLTELKARLVQSTREYFGNLEDYRRSLVHKIDLARRNDLLLEP